MGHYLTAVLKNNCDFHINGSIKSVLIYYKKGYKANATLEIRKFMEQIDDYEVNFRESYEKINDT